MNNSASSPREARTISRRTLAKGAAWSVPTFAVASAVPAFAASPVVCPPILTGASTTTTNGFTNLGQTYQEAVWTSADQFSMNVDEFRGERGQVGVLTNASPVTVIGGQTHVLEISAQAQYGFAGSGTCTTYDTTVEVQFTPPGGTAATLWTGTTRASVAGATLVRPPGTCTGSLNSQRTFGYGHNGVLNQSFVTTKSFVPAASGTGQISLKFTMAYDGLVIGSTNCNGTTRPCNGTNDDWKIRLRFTQCLSP